MAQKLSYPSSYNIPNISKRQNRGTNNITQKKRANPSFPFLEMGYPRLRHETTEHNSSRGRLGNWWNKGTVGKQYYYRTLNRGIRKRALGGKGSRFKITYMEQKAIVEL